MAKENVYKIIVVGDSNVGKTSLTYLYCEGKQLESSTATIGMEFRSKTIVVNNEKIKLNVWDTAGMERHRNSMVAHYYRNAHAVILVYDMTSRKSFISLSKWIEECSSYQSDDMLMVLVGNKCDADPEMIEVSTNEAFQFADQHNMPIFNTSAKLDEEIATIDSIFSTLAIKLVNNRKLMRPSVLALPPSTTTKNNSFCC